ncbi:MAG: hypothetical protein K2H39_07235 [Paramuribaculum sp.]|nr:hypothetical protein [Paramuribaculum sp.]
MKIRKFLTSALLLVSAISASAECEIAIGLAPFITEGDPVPAGVERKLQAKLKMALSHTGVAAGDYDCQFFLIGRFDEAFSQEAGGVGGRVMVKSELQLAICDGDNKKVYATATFPLKGVGANNEQALTRALGSLNTNNQEFITFVDRAKAKIVEYFNKNYPTYITKATTALNQRNYDEALYWATSVPECCDGYQQAHALATKIYNDRTDYEGANLLAKAEGEWAANPTAAGAQAAYRYLSQIDPASSSYQAAKNLGKKMSASVKADYDFETKEKYRNAVALEQQRIKAARDVAVAWAKNQPKTIVHHNWIVW